MKLPIMFAILALVAFKGNVFAKPWRGIVPLISTRADVERLLGKPNDFGLYELNGEAASVIFRRSIRDGVTIRAKQVRGNAVEVITITYGPSSEDNKLRCRVP